MPLSIRRTARVLSPLLATLGLLLAIPASAPASFDLPKVKGWWPLNEGRGQVANDWSGNRNHGQLGSTPSVDSNDPTWIKGIFWGSGLNFDGDDFVAIKDSTSLKPQRFTLSLWARAPQSPGPFTYLIAKGSSACTAASYGIWTGSHGGIDFYVWNGGDMVRAAGTPNGIWDGKWHNISATWDGTNARLYIDGVSLGETPGRPTDIAYDSQPDGTTSFGGYRGSCDLMFSGDIDQVMLFDRPLPIEEIWDRWGFILNKPTLG
jgi:hypothetical protein